MGEFKWQYKKFGDTIKPESYKRYSILLTNDCNLSCKYCFQRYTRDNTPMSKETLISFLDKVRDIEIPKQSQEDVFISFCGGEVLMEVELLDFALEYAKEKFKDCGKKVSYGILTNGTLLLNKQVQERMLKHKDVLIQVSLDGKRDTHDSNRGRYNETIAGIRWLQINGFNLRVAMTVSPDNVGNFAQGFSFIANMLKCTEIWVSVTVDDERWNEDIYVEKLYAELNKIVGILLENNEVWSNIFDPIQFLPSKSEYYVCPALSCQLTCAPNGKLYPCYVHMNVGDMYSYGDTEAWIDPEKYKNISSCTLQNCKSTNSEVDCQNCSMGNGCKRCSGYLSEKYGALDIYDTQNCKVHHAKYWAFINLCDGRNKLNGK